MIHNFKKMQRIYIDASVYSFDSAVGSATGVVIYDPMQDSFRKIREFYFNENYKKFDFLNDIEFSTIKRYTISEKNTLIFIDRSLHFLQSYFNDNDTFSLASKNNNIFIGITKIQIKKRFSEDIKCVYDNDLYYRYIVDPLVYRSSSRPLQWEVQKPGINISNLCFEFGFNYPKNLANAHIISSLYISEKKFIEKIGKRHSNSKSLMKYLFLNVA